jgi:Fur family ferric uptake transcriptional regulator
MVLHLIAGSHDYLTPADIYQKVHQEHPQIGLVTIYRTLQMLAELGLLCKLHIGGICGSYVMRRPAGHHHHLICSRCGRVVEFAGCDFGELEQRLTQETGFKLEGHLLEFLGWCPECRRLAKA